MGCCSLSKKSDINFISEYNEGKLFEGYRNQDGKFGKWTSYQNGNVESEGSYYRDMKVGLWRYYKNKIQIRSINFIDDNRHGLFKSYHLNGRIKTQGLYHYNDMQGLWLVNDNFGINIMKVYYWYGKRNNLCLHNRLITFYIDDIEVSSKQYHLYLITILELLSIYFSNDHISIIDLYLF
jgi:antitoxin component YwqK of YwqJK toxin-antitoxin module